jgi:hypothetical protein
MLYWRVAIYPLFTDLVPNVHDSGINLGAQQGFSLGHAFDRLLHLC